MRRLILVVVLIGWSVPVLALDEQQVQQAIQQAKQAFEKAVAAQGGWVSTSKLLKQASLSAAKGDRQKALTLADKAKREAELSYTQALNQKKNWSEPDYLAK
jgi:hypothetical protein